jgi:hypothetical protein
MNVELLNDKKVFFKPCFTDREWRFFWRLGRRLIVSSDLHVEYRYAGSVSDILVPRILGCGLLQEMILRNDFDFSFCLCFGCDFFCRWACCHMFGKRKVNIFYE